VRIFRNRSEMKLVADEAGDPAAPAVLFLHGGGQTRHSWGAATTLLAEAGFYALTIDLRGHGDSDWSPDGDYDLAGMRDDIFDILAQLPQGRPALVGASMGGLAALFAAGGDDPSIVRALVLVDVVPQIEMEGAQEIRAFMTGAPDGFASVEAAADAVAAYLPHRPRRSSNAGLLKNLRQRDNGRYYWHWDPRMMQDGGRFDPAARRQTLEDAARRVTAPTLLIRGGLSRVVSLEGAAAFQQIIPHAEFVNIEQADHMVAGDANDAFNAPLIDFMKRTR
jgi:pimeloyl-ACP methyl ester carboxylesterase